MTRLLPPSLALSLAFAALPAMANPQLDAAKTCLADATSGKDRKVLAKWIFGAMAAHPEMAALSKVTPADQEQLSRDFGALFTRLMTVDCADEIRSLARDQGPSTIGTAFEHLGAVAMQELMGNPAVNAAISDFEKHVDQAALAPVLGVPGAE